MAKITKAKTKAATALQTVVVNKNNPPAQAAVNYFALQQAQNVLRISYKTPEVKKESKAYKMREYIRAGHTDAECIAYGMSELGMTKALAKVYALGHRARISKE